MSVKRGLGSGLGALLGDEGTSDVTTAPKRDLQQIPLDRIRPNPLQPRRTFAPEALDELRGSIVAFGVLVPVIVRERGDGFELIAGERRLRAAQAAGLRTIPAIVRAAGDSESLEVAIIENLQRENLDALEEAMGFAHLIEAYDFTQERVAQRVGKSRPTIANALRLLSLSDTIKQYVRDGKLTAGHARALLALPVERRETMAQRAIDDELSVRALERLAQDAGAKRTRTAPARRVAYRRRSAGRALALPLRYASAFGGARAGRNDRAALRRCGRPDANRRSAARRLVVNAFARIACALACAATIGAAPAIRYGPVPAHNAQTVVVQKYVDAIKGGDYAAAYGLLTDELRRYFGDVDAFRSVFQADGYVLERATIVGARGDNRGRVYFVRETLAFVDHATDKQARLTATVPLGVLPEHGALHVKDPGKPYRAFAASSSSDASGLRVTVKKVDFFPDRIDVVVTFANSGDNYVTVLPYGRSVLRDDRGGVYRIVASKDWTVTDRRLFEGVPLPPGAQYTGSLAFAAQRFGDVKRSWTLTLAPALREGSDAPFDVTVPIAPTQ